MSSHDITVARLVMVTGMAGMLLPLPVIAWWALAGVFAVDAGWLCWRLGRRGWARGEVQVHRLHHLVCHLAMLYLIILMAIQPPGRHAMSGMAMGAGSGMGSMLLLAIDLGIVIYFVAVGVWATLRLVPALASGPVAGVRVGTIYQLVVSGAMLYMLFAALRG